MFFKSPKLLFWIHSRSDTVVLPLLQWNYCTVTTVLLTSSSSSSAYIRPMLDIGLPNCHAIEFYLRHCKLQQAIICKTSIFLLAMILNNIPFFQWVHGLTVWKYKLSKRITTGWLSLIHTSLLVIGMYNFTSLHLHVSFITHIMYISDIAHWVTVLLIIILQSTSVIKSLSLLVRFLQIWYLNIWQKSCHLKVLNM